MSTTQIVVRKGAPAVPRRTEVLEFVTPKAKAALATTITSVTRTRKRQRANRANKVGFARTPGGSSLRKDYVNTLIDPFQYGPVRLGFGTMVPTSIASAYFRGALTTNADGSFAMALFPALGSAGQGTILSNTSGAASTTWVTSRFTNESAIYPCMAECRVISGGIRVAPLQAQTDAAGLIYCGSLPSATINDLEILTPTTMSALQQSSWAISRTGGAAMTRPLDINSFTFFGANMIASAGTVSTSSCPYVVGIGLTASSKVAFEVVLNLEGIAGFGLSTTPTVNTPGASGGAQPALSDYFPSVDSLWSSIKNVLPPPEEYTSSLRDIISRTFVDRLVGGGHMSSGGYSLLRD